VATNIEGSEEGVRGGRGHGSKPVGRGEEGGGVAKTLNEKQHGNTKQNYDFPCLI
jgi:hypothetical protein